jgi:hypothetical protein
MKLNLLRMARRRRIRRIVRMLVVILEVVIRCLWRKLRF